MISLQLTILLLLQHRAATVITHAIYWMCRGGEALVDELGASYPEDMLDESVIPYFRLMPPRSCPPRRALETNAPGLPLDSRPSGYELLLAYKSPLPPPPAETLSQPLPPQPGPQEARGPLPPPPQQSPSMLLPDGASMVSPTAAARRIQSDDAALADTAMLPALPSSPPTPALPPAQQSESRSSACLRSPFAAVLLDARSPPALPRSLQLTSADMLRRSRRTLRSAVFAERRNRLRAVGQVLSSTPGRVWLQLAFVSRLLRCLARTRLAVEHRATVLLRATLVLRPQCARFVALLHSRVAVRRRLSTTPCPMLGYDVGYNAGQQQLIFRSPTGEVTSAHPAGVAAGTTVPAFSADARIVSPMWPPPSSRFVLSPEASGAWCYYHIDLGHAHWCAPAGSLPLQLVKSQPLLAEPFSSPPPMLDPQIDFNSLNRVGWLALYADADSDVQLYCLATGSVRDDPWIALRTSAGGIYFANLVTRRTRWFPPYRWLDGWVSRAVRGAAGELTGCPLVHHAHFSRQLLPIEIARLRVEGGASYLGATGSPRYAAVSPDALNSISGSSSSRCAAGSPGLPGLISACA